MNRIPQENNSIARRLGKQTCHILLLAATLLCLSPLDACAQKISPTGGKRFVINDATGSSSACSDKKIIASDLPMRVPVIPTDDPLPKPKTKHKLLKAVMETTINAPPNFVWNKLTDFSGYPQVFPRIESVKVQKREGNYVYTETELKPQMFVRQTRQHVVNDLSAKPTLLRWAMIDGNFECTQGAWQVTANKDGKSCNVKYTLESTAEPVPAAIAEFTLKMIQKDIVKNFKKSTEKLYQTQQASRGSDVALND